MNQHKYRADIVFIAFLLALIVLALAPGDAYASGDCRNGSCNEVILSGGDNTANNSASVGGSDTMAFSHSLGDVDINDCLASTQWGTILVSRQRVVLNKWCAAEVYDYKGLHHMAALLRCDIKEIGDFFESREECLKANTVSFNEVSRGTPEALLEETEVSDEYADDVEQILSRLSELESRNSELQAEYDALEARRQASIRSARDARNDERAYAQSLLEELSDE